MLEKDHWLIRQADLDSCKDMIRLENRTAFRVMTVTGCVLSVFNLVTQIVITGFGMPLFRSGLMLACFSLMLFFDRAIIPDDIPLPTWALYAAQAPILLLSVLLGTIWDTEHQGTTILLFLLTAPAFIMDHPRRSVSILIGWGALFALLSYFVKASPIREYDMIHAIEFMAASAAVSYTVVRFRLKSMMKRKTLLYQLDHDRDTECQNRYAFEGRIKEYIGKPVTVVLSDVDRLTLYSDFYGKSIADEIMNHFTRTLMKQYGDESVFHYGEDEVLCIIPGEDEELPERIAADCRKEMHGFTKDGYRIAVTFSQGRVNGIPRTTEEMQSMVHLAQIYAHRAGAQSRDGDWCGAWSEEALQEATADANVSASHVKAYETNPLSGLPTMTYFCMRVDELLTNLADLEAIPVVGYFKLTMLKEFNDEFGYRQGDKLIAEAAKAIREAFPYRLVGHITAGQFCFFCYLAETYSGTDKLLEELRRMHPEFAINGKAGFAEYTGRESATELLDLARIAQRSIMNRQDMNCTQYSLDLDEELRFRQYIVNHLEEAIEKEWLQVYYQPIIRAKTNKVCCEEALSRWDDPNRGFLTPNRFISPLEEEGLMYKLNLAVVDRVLKDSRKREETGIPVVPVSINLSRKDFLQCDMVEEIAARIAKAGYTPDILRIEITESAFVANQEKLAREVKRFRERGFKVWMDDFGSEYSTLNLLQDLDFDLVKIDMQFMKNLAPGSKNHVIVTNAIRMIRELGSGTLMEGIETREQEQMLREMGCELLQGFLFSKPISFSNLVERVQKNPSLIFETTQKEKQRHE